MALRIPGVAEPRSVRYPFSLTTGRLRGQWRGMSHASTLARLFSHAPEPALQMHPQDVARRGLQDGDLAYITSVRGSIVVPVQSSDEMAPEQVFLAMHWGKRIPGRAYLYRPASGGVKCRSPPAFCPTSKQPRTQARGPSRCSGPNSPGAWWPAPGCLRIRPWHTQRHGCTDGRVPFALCVPFSSPCSPARPRTAQHACCCGPLH